MMPYYNWFFLHSFDLQTLSVASHCSLDVLLHSHNILHFMVKYGSVELEGLMLAQHDGLLHSEFLEAGCAVFSMVMRLFGGSIVGYSWLECALFKLFSLVDDAVICLPLASLLGISI